MCRECHADVAKLLSASQRQGAWDEASTLSTQTFWQASSLVDCLEGNSAGQQQAPVEATQSSLTLTSPWAAQLAACMALEVMDFCLSRFSAQTGLHMSDSLLQALTWMLRNGGLSLQTAALKLTITVVQTLSAQQLPFTAIAEAVLASLAAWTSPPEDTPAKQLQAWQDAILACLNILLQAGCTAQTVTAIAARMAIGLANAIRAAGAKVQLQAALGGLLTGLAQCWPPVLACLPGLVPLAAGNPALGLQLVRCLGVLADEIKTSEELDAVVRQGLDSPNHHKSSQQVCQVPSGMLIC